MVETLKIFNQATGDLLAEISNGTSIGRGSENKLLIKDDSISRFHAEILQFGNEWFLFDSGSTNGSLLNQTSLIPGELYLLRSNDVITFGSFSVFIKVSARLSEKPNILVFRGKEYEGNFAMGKDTDFRFGGPQATIKGDEGEGDAIFTIKIKDQNLFLSPKTRDRKVFLNNQNIWEETLLTDRDQIKVNDRVFICSLRPAPLPQEESSGSNKQINNEMPDYLRSRINNDDWANNENKPRTKEKTLLSIDTVIADELRSQGAGKDYNVAELGAQRFSRANLATVKLEKESSDKKNALLGLLTVMLLTGMISFLYHLYRGVIF